MITRQQIIDEIDLAESRCIRCPSCAEKPALYYDVGSTVVYCRCVKMAFHDWRPKEALRAWNQLSLQPVIDQETADIISHRFNE